MCGVYSIPVYAHGVAMQVRKYLPWHTVPYHADTSGVPQGETMALLQQR